MQVIHYLNFTSQLFSAAADIITTTSVESAGLLRSLSSARHIHAGQLWAIAGQVRHGDAQDNHKDFYPDWRFDQMPPAIGTGDDIGRVTEVLKAVIQTETALQGAPYVISWTNQNPIFDGIINASKSIVTVIQRVLARLEKDEAKIWACGNCWTFAQGSAPDACPLCGVGKNWFKPYTRI